MANGGNYCHCHVSGSACQIGLVGGPRVIACPDDEIDFIGPDFLDVFECCVDEGVWRITWAIGDSVVPRSPVVVVFEFPSVAAVLRVSDWIYSEWVGTSSSELILFFLRLMRRSVSFEGIWWHAARTREPSR
jgi:hypothetical protein